MTARFTDHEVMTATGATRARSGGGLPFEARDRQPRVTPGCLFVALRAIASTRTTSSLTW